MEKFGVEVGVKIRYLDEKRGKNYILHSIFIPFLKLKKIFLKPYLESPFHINLKNRITIEFICSYDGEIG